MALGYPAEPHGINAEGLRRRGYSAEAISAVRNAYKTVYRQGLTLTEALAKLEQDAAIEAAVDVLFDSLKDSSRGIIR